MTNTFLIGYTVGLLTPVTICALLFLVGAISARGAITRAGEGEAENTGKLARSGEDENENERH